MQIRVINPNTTLSMTAKIDAAARSIAANGTKIVTVGPEMGPASIEGHYDEAIAVPGLLAEIAKGETDGADGYVIRIVAVTGDRVVWESAPITATETKLPPTVALEPEVHTWSVSARKGGSVLVTSPTQRFTITP